MQESNFLEKMDNYSVYDYSLKDANKNKMILNTQI